MYFFLEFLPFTKTTIGAILKNASSPFEFNSDAAAQGPSNPGRYNAMSSADRNPRRHSGKRSVIAGMTSVSLALAGLTVPSVVGGELEAASAAIDYNDQNLVQARLRRLSKIWTANLTLAPDQGAKTFSKFTILVPDGIDSKRVFPDELEYSVSHRLGTEVLDDFKTLEGKGGVTESGERTLTFDLGRSIELNPGETVYIEYTGDKLKEKTYFPTDAGGTASKIVASLDSSSSEPGSVSGSVTPVPGTSVKIVDGDGKEVEGAQVTIDDQGNVSITEVPEGSYTVVVTPPEGYGDPVERDVKVDPGKNTPFDRVDLEKQNGSVSGSVTPVPGTSVKIVDGDGKEVEGAQVTIDDQGNVSITEVPEGNYTVVVTPPEGYGDPVERDVKVDPGKNTPFDRVDLEKTPTSTVTTTSTKPTTKPVEPTTTNPTTSKLTPTSTVEPTTTKPTTPTSIKTTATKPTTPTSIKTTATKPTTPTSIKTTATKPTTSATTPTVAPASSTDSKPKNPSIIGTVTDPDGKPLPPSKDKDGKPKPPTVIVKDKDGNQVGDPIKVDENGNFEVPEVPEDGDYVVIVDAPDGFNDPKPQVVPVEKGKTSKLPPIKVGKPEIELDKNKPAAQPGSVHGWLVDDSNRPITGSDIKLVKKGVTDPETGEKFDYEVPIKVDADGYFVTPSIDFKYFPDGKADFDLEVTLPAGWPDVDVNGDKINRTVTVKSGESTPVEIKVEAPKTQSIVGRVDDGNGKAVPGTVVVVTDPRGNSRVIPVEDDGSFEIDDVIPGVHDVEILTPGRGNDADPIKVPVRAGEDVELPEIHLTENKSLKLEKRVWGRDADNNGQIENEDGELVDDVMTVKDGEDLLYALIVTNDGDTPIKDITFDDPELEKRNIELTMPEGYVLPPGESKVVSAKMKAPEDAFDFNNVATASGVTSKGEKVSSLPDSAYTKFLRGAVSKKVNARFATNKDKPVKAEANSPLGFTYEVTNTGSTPMVNVSLTDIVYEDGVDEDKCEPAKASDKTEDSQCYDLDVKAPEDFNGTLLPGERVIFTAELPEGLKEGAKHHNAAEARGELPARPGRGDSYTGEPEYGEDPSSVLIISPKDNIKGNAHVVVSEGAEIDSNDVQVVAWVDENGNGKQDPDEALTGLKISLAPSDGTPSFAGDSDENGNVLFEATPYGKYTVKIDSPGKLRLADPKDPENNTFDPGAVLESKEFEVSGELANEEGTQIINLELETPRTAGISEGGAAQDEEEGSSLGKCLASASSVSNPVAWLVPLGLLGAVMGGIGVMFEDELNQVSAQANAALRQALPETSFGNGFNFERPQWMNEIQAQIDGVNRQLAEINPAAPAAAGGVALLALAGLLTGLYYASCELGWAEPKEGGSSSKADAEGTEGVAGSSSSSAEGSSSKKVETEAEAEADNQPEEAAN